MDDEHQDQHSTKKKKRQFPSWLKTVVLIVGWILIVGIAIGALVWATNYLDKRTTDPVQFVTGNLLNVLIVIAILGQIYIYRNQWTVMKQQLKSSDGHSRNTLRAYVNIRSGNAFVAELNRANVQLEIVNFGQTPANYVRTVINAEVRMLNNPPPVLTPADIPVDEGKGIPIAPQMAVGRIAETVTPITTEEAEFMEAGKARLFVWGIVTYKDIFSRSRYTSFCSIHAYPGTSLAPWREGNKAT